MLKLFILGGLSLIYRGAESWRLLPRRNSTDTTGEDWTLALYFIGYIHLVFSMGLMTLLWSMDVSNPTRILVPKCVLIFMFTVFGCFARGCSDHAPAERGPWDPDWRKGIIIPHAFCFGSVAIYFAPDRWFG